MGKKSNKSEADATNKESTDKKIKKKITKENNIGNIIKNLSQEILKRSEDKTEGRWVDLDSERPTPRSHSTLTQIPGGMAVMFGGEFYDGLEIKLYNDTFLYNLSSNTWKKLESPSVPLPRCSHQAVYYRNRIYIFGGEFNTMEQFHHFNDTMYLCLSTLRWNTIKAKGSIPSPRSGHRMVLWKDYSVLFGGFYDNGKDCNYYNDLYYFDLKNEIWYQVDQKMFSNSLPEPRGGCLLVALNDEKHLLMHGGFTKRDTVRNVSGISHQDTWLIDMNTVISNTKNSLVWSKINTKSNHEFSTGISYVSDSNTGYLFGGVKDVDQGLSVHSTFTNKCFKLNLNQRKFNPTPIDLEGDVKEDSLTELSDLSVTKSAPTPRMNANLAIHNNTLYVMGGIVEIKNVEITLSDVWSLDLDKKEWKCVDRGFQNLKVYNQQMELEYEESDTDEEMDSDDETEEDSQLSEDSEEESESEYSNKLI